MKNVTITLDEETVAWARIHAAEQGKSVSRLVSELLRERMDADRGYERAMHAFLSIRPRVLKWVGKPYPTRDELYDRGRLR